MNNHKIVFRMTGIIATFGGSIAVLGFLLLAKTFGYPDIIRESPKVILEKLHEQRHIVPYVYYMGIGIGGLCLVFTSMLLKKIFNLYGEDLWSYLGHICGSISRSPLKSLYTSKNLLAFS